MQKQVLTRIDDVERSITNLAYFVSQNYPSFAPVSTSTPSYTVQPPIDLTDTHTILATMHTNTITMPTNTTTKHTNTPAAHKNPTTTHTYQTTTHKPHYYTCTYFHAYIQPHCYQCPVRIGSLRVDDCQILELRGTAKMGELASKLAHESFLGRN